MIAEAERRGKRVNEIAFEREVQQGKNIVDAVSKQTSTLERFVLSTLSDSKRWSNGEITWNLHFDGKAGIATYLKQTYPSLAEKTSYFQIGVYLDNWKIPLMRPAKQPDGTFVLHVTEGRGDKGIPWVHAQTDTGHFVKALISAPPKTSILGCSRLMTTEDHWKLWAQIKGVKLVVHTDKTLPAAGLPEWMVQELSESKLYVSKYGWAGGDPEVKLPQDAGVEMDKLTDIEQYMREESYEGFV